MLGKYDSSMFFLQKYALFIKKFVLENGIDMFLWIGANVDPSHVQNLFGVPNVQQLNVEKVFILAIIIGIDVFIC